MAIRIHTTDFVTNHISFQFGVRACSGNTAQRLCDRCVVKFFVRWNKKRSEYWMYSRAFLWNMRVCFVSDVCRLRRQIFWEMKGKTEKILCGFSSIFPKYLGKYARKMRAGRYETGSEGKFASRWRAKSPDALCAVLPQAFSGILFTWIEKSHEDSYKNVAER